MTKLLLIFWTAISLTAIAANADEEQARLKALMHTFLMEMSRMNPYLNSESGFRSSVGKQVVGSSLSILERKVQDPPSPFKESTGFRITFSLLADHITKTKALFDKGEMEYARIRLVGTTNLCASCHMQTPKISSHSPFAKFADDANVKPNYDSATFQFSIRRYDAALAQFDRLVREYPQSGLLSDQLADLYRRKLSIFARVKRDPDAGIQNLTEDLKNAKIPVDIKQNIRNWISALEKWKKEDQDPAKLNSKDLIAFVAQKFPIGLNRKIAPADPELLNLLRLSGLLYERLYSEKDSALTQELLYSLALCERSLSPFPWYSLNEIYLKECVIRFPKQPLSKKCYEAYRDGMAERFMNRSIPESIQINIDALKDYI